MVTRRAIVLLSSEAISRVRERNIVRTKKGVSRKKSLMKILINMKSP
jgi:hypothetical protein